MSPRAVLALALVLCARQVAAADTADPRVRDIAYEAKAVVTVPVKRGVVTHILLDADESITDVASGLGSDCARPEAVWCIAAQPGSRNIFAKAKSGASLPNNLAVVTDKRTHSFTLVVLADADARPPVHRLTVQAPVVRTVVAARFTPPAPLAPPPALPTLPEPVPEDLIAERLKTGPEVVNASYSIAEGKASEEIVPTLVFDDGRFTYFRFPGNREVPAVFHVLGDGNETLVNTRMEDDLLVVDRVSRRLMLRAGSAVVGIWNEAFDLDGLAPVGATTVRGVQRTVRDQGGGSSPWQLKAEAAQ